MNLDIALSDEAHGDLGPYLVTPYPGPKTRALVERLQRVEGAGMRTAADYPLVSWEEARGVYVWDADGNRYLDLYSGFAAANIGHAHPKVTAAIQGQAARLTHVSSAYPTSIRAELMEKLISLAPSGIARGLFTITGGQANDLAIRLARRATGRNEFIAFRGGYFGRDTGVLGLNAKATFRRGLHILPGAHFFPFPYSYRCSFGNRHSRPEECENECLEYLETALHDPASGIGEVAAIILEPVQGNGGIIIPSGSFLRGLRRICDEFGILLIFDEIQSGFGRTGKLWASEHSNVVPDLMTIGKGIGGGLAVSAVLGREKPMCALDPGQHTSTFLTNALTHRAALAALEVMIEEKLWEHSAALGSFLLSSLSARFNEHPHVGEIRGLGLFIGLEIVKDRETRQPAPELASRLLQRARDAGLILGLSGYFGNVIKIAPPLVIHQKQLEVAIQILDDVFRGT